MPVDLDLAVMRRAPSSLGKKGYTGLGEKGYTRYWTGTVLLLHRCYRAGYCTLLLHCYGTVTHYCLCMVTTLFVQCYLTLVTAAMG